jgi:hemerythrin-like domain-containing protein
MKLTDRLKVEHGVFLRQLACLDALCAAHASPTILRAVVETIASAEEQHALVEERALYPELQRVLGASAAPLEAAATDHRVVADLVATIRRPGFEVAHVAAFSAALRAHLEREIHDVFRLAEELLSEERLSSLCNWDEEHVFDVVGEREKWLGKLDRSDG